MTLILWSGGCDSTLVLWNACKKAKKEGKEMPRALSINHAQVGANREQYRARRSIWKKLKARGYDFKWAEVSIVGKGMFYPVSEGHSLQPPIWIPQAVLYLKAKEELQCGWIRGDDTFHHMAEVRWTFNYLMQLSGKSGTLSFPLEWTPKFMVLSELRKAKLVSLPWTCEEPRNWRACGKCKPCLELKTAQYRLKLEGG